MKKINDLVAHLKNTFHLDINILDEESNFLNKIPFAIKNNYETYKINILGEEILLLETDDEDIGLIKKHLNIFENATSVPVAIYVKNISNSTKKYFIENAIPFISLKSVYLPQLLIYLNNLKEKYKRVRDKKLSKLAQEILISSIINKKQHLEINSCAKKFNVTNMSSGRALSELVDFEYLYLKETGRKKEFLAANQIEIEKLLSDLKNPIMDVVYIKEVDLSYFHNKLLSSSYNALSHYANIVDNERAYAIEKNYFNSIVKKNNQLSMYDKRYDSSFVKIELWKYIIKGSNNVVDPISLYLSLRELIDLEDSRLVKAMNELYQRIRGMIN